MKLLLKNIFETKIIAVFLFTFVFTTSVNAANTYTVPGDFETIQEAIDASSIGYYIDENSRWVWDRDTILVGPGTYFENLTIQNKSLILKSTDGADTTIIDGGQAGSVLRIYQSSNNSSAITTRPIIEGFTLTNGNSSAGGGVNASPFADPSFKGMIIKNNTAKYGGGVYAGYGVCFITFEDSVISENHAEYIGGGIYGSISCTTLRNSSLINNTAGQSGGGVATLGFCTGFGAFESIIAGNSALDKGGAMYNYGSSSCGSNVRATNSLLANNSAEFGGGVYVGSYGGGYLSFSTVANNTASSMGGGFYGEDYGESAEIKNPYYTILNSIIYRNNTNPVLPIIRRGNTMNLIAGSDIEGCLSNPDDYLGGYTNICVDPLFVDPDSGDFSLSANSPAIDIAITSFTRPDGSAYFIDMVDVDIDGNSRPEGNGYDIGAYEFTLPIIEVPVNLDPDTLNLKSKGNWITSYITLPSEYDPNDVLLPSVMINNSIPADRSEVQGGILMIKFNRDLLANYLAGEDGQVQLTVTGEIYGQAIFVGTDQINAMKLPTNNLKGEERIKSIGQ